MSILSHVLAARLTVPKLCLMSILLLAPFYYQPNIGGSGLNIPSNVTVWVVVSFFIWLSVLKIIRTGNVELPQNSLLITAFPLLATLSGFISGVSEPIEWGFRLLFIWGGLFFLLGLFQLKLSRSQKDWLLFSIVSAGFLHALIAFLQTFQPDGVIIYLPKTAGENIATGVFQQINNHASFQATVILTAWYLVNRPIAMSNRWIKVVLAVTVFFSTYIVMTSGSRVGFISVVLGLLILMSICWRKMRVNWKNSLLMLLMMSQAITITTVLGGFDRLTEKSTVIHTEHEVDDRVSIYRISAELMHQKPFFGHGLGSFESAWQYQKADFQERHPSHSLVDSYISHPHNELVFWQVEGGMLSSLGILISFFTVLAAAWRSRARYTIALLFPLAFHNQVELPFHVSATSWFVCLILIYIATSHSQTMRLRAIVSPAMTSCLAVINHVVFFVAMVFLLHCLWAGSELNKATKPNTTADLSIPLMNPYFTQLAEDFRMQQIFKMSSIERNTNMMQAFNLWQQEAILYRPTDYNFKMLIASFQNLQDLAKACETAHLASLMYARNKEFQNYTAACSK